MNTPRYGFSKLIAAAVVSLLLAACASGSGKPDGANNVRNKLARLQSDSQLASRAPVAMKDAEAAVRAAETPQKDAELSKHLVFMADRKIEIARAIAQTRLAEDQRSTLTEQRQDARLDSRTREADRARGDARDARMDAEIARTDADMARIDADMARMDTDAALRESDDLQRQIEELNAKETERGLVVTLGDLLFDTGRSELKGGAADHLTKLAAFLNKYPERSAIIEGHTDSVGSENSNLALSKSRANSVKSFLIDNDVNAGRLEASGMGENSPIASNDSTSGRQQNRRVEVIISNPVASR